MKTQTPTFAMGNVILIAPEVPPFVQRLKSIIEAHYQDHKFDISEISHLLHLCPMQVYRKTKEYSGMTPGKFLLNYRFFKALHLLIDTELSIGEIAWETGFNSHSSFTRAFQRVFKKSPKQFRKAMWAGKSI